MDRLLTTKILLIIVLLALIRPVVRAQRVSDDITISVLTCSPGEQVYELYGHTALRVEDHTLGTDVVFNYGVFDFSKPAFVWRFLLGQTDYIVAAYPYSLFLEEYIQRGSSVVSQRLNLTTAESNRLYNMLIENARPENRTYRYNFLTNDCTTKVRDMYEAAIDGTVVYTEQPKTTYRESLHEFTKNSPWTEASEDLLLGAPTDTLLDDHTAQFLPFHLRSYIADAKIYDVRQNARPLMLGDEEVLLEAREMPMTKSFPLSPIQCLLLFALFVLIVFAIEYWTRRQMWVVDLLLMPGLGVAGVLVTFMFFFSEHPTVDSNWQIWLYNPLPLVCMPWVVKSAIQHKECFYHYANAAVLTLFIVSAPWTPQTYSIITIPLALCLLTRPVSYIINFKRLKPRKSKARSRK